METKQKILLCGDIEGRFDAAFHRISNINKKSGPFDLVLCVGNFFGINNKEFEPYKTGEKKVSVPTYILGANKADHKQFFSDSQYELCPNVYYLGKRGLYTSSGGLKIAYISGVYSDTESDSGNTFNYTVKDIQELYDVCVRGNSNFRGIDILLSSQWPSGITKNTTAPQELSNASDLLAWLTLKLKPRYVISGLEGIHFERAPFRCRNLTPDGDLEIVTRFIALARVGNPKKEKWIYALSLTPLDRMRIADLLQRTTDETECPFDFEQLESTLFKKKRKTVGFNQYFYDPNAEEQQAKTKKVKREKVTFDQSKCWFCLASPSVEKHLVITIGDHAYLALAKGGIVEEHLMICPIEHHQSAVGQPKEVQDEIQQFKDALKSFYERNGNVAVFFERNYKTSHMQLQAVPIPKQATRELKEIFRDEAEGNGFELQELDPHNRFDQVVPSGAPYFFVELPDGTVLYAKIQKSANFPLNFAREVLANGAILNKPNRIDWKDCILNREQEEEVVQRIRSDFEPFDFTM